VTKEEANKRTVISSWTALLAYVRLSLQHEPREQFRVLYLDKKNQLILDEIQNRGTVDHALSIRARWCAGRWNCRPAP
jgi:DNA repair protein RadC